MEHLFFFWLVISLLCLIMEMGSPGLFYFLSFFFGAVVAALVSVYVDSWIIQSMIFLIGTTFALVALKYWIKSSKQTHKAPLTNVYALQGKHGIVLVDIAPGHPGQIKVQGEVWSALAADDMTIKAGTFVQVVAIGGAYLTVTEIKK